MDYLTECSEVPCGNFVHEEGIQMSIIMFASIAATLFLIILFLIYKRLLAEEVRLEVLDSYYIGDPEQVLNLEKLPKNIFLYPAKDPEEKVLLNILEVYPKEKKILVSYSYLVEDAFLGIKTIRSITKKVRLDILKKSKFRPIPKELWVKFVYSPKRF